MINSPAKDSTDRSQWIKTVRATRNFGATLVIEVTDPAGAGSAFYVFNPPATEGAYTLDDIVSEGTPHETYESALQASPVH